MKISVLIIAHNEERYIERCIKSILKQWNREKERPQRVDEIILLLHNSTDKTEAIARKYQHKVKIIPFESKPGIVYARMEGLRHVTGDIILCIDGDSYAEYNWVEEMTKAITDESSLVGSRVNFRKTLFGRVLNIVNHFTFLFGSKNAEWIWGQSFAFDARLRNEVIQVYERSIALTKQAHLSRNPDDYWMALLLGRKECVEVIGSTSVICNTKERTSWHMLKRYVENIRNARKIRKYQKKHPSLEVINNLEDIKEV